MRALCIGRHRYLSEHLVRFFGQLGVEAEGVVGIAGASERAGARRPELVLCEYDLLTADAITAWESDPVLGAVPLIAVSLTRRPGEAPLLASHGVAGFLYLPTLRPEDARRVLRTSGPPPGYRLSSHFDVSARVAAASPP